MLSIRYLLAILLLSLGVNSVAGGGRTMDYAWLLFLKVNEPPVVDAGLDQTITWAADSVYLDATVSDDPRDTLKYTWTKLDDPDYDGFGSPNAEDTTATLSTSGTYIFQLSVSDGELTSESTVAITLSNSAPTVNAGSDKTLYYPTLSTFINATASDHPMDFLNYSWSTVDGPGVVTFGSRYSEDTQATFSKSGIYNLKLSVSDGDLSSSDPVKVTIVNNPPVVNIIRDSIPTESGSVDLSPEVTDSTSGMLTYQWSRISGPGTVTFSNPQAVSTSATLSVVGSYVLKLTASDGELPGSDTVTVEYTSQPIDKIDVIVAVGDSITVGFGDSDCVYQNAKACSGYTPRLKNKLAGTAKYAAGLIIQERGVGGTTSAYGLSVIDSIISAHPYADQYLVMYGTNDAEPDPPPSKASFKYNMRRIAEKINAVRGMNPALAKAPYAIGVDAYRNVAIQQYNQAVRELYLDNGFITISPPDFYSYFQVNTDQIWPYHMFTKVPEGVHPRAAGYDAMANIWFNQLK